MAVHAERGVSLAQVTVDSVGVTDGDGGDDGARTGLAPSAVTHGVPFTQMLDLQDLAFQGSDRGELDARHGADAVDADTQAHHVVLVLRKTLDAGGVEDMAHGHVADSRRDGLRVLLEKAELGGREGIFLGIVGDTEVGKHGFHLHLRVRVQEIHQRGNLRGHESQAVHACVQFDMDGVVPQADFPEMAAEGVQRLQVRNAGLHACSDDFGVEVRARRQDDDRQADTVLPQLQPLHGIGDGQVIGPGALHHRGKLHGAVSVCIGLDENQQFRRGGQQGTEIPVIALTALQVQLQPGKIILSHHFIR